jgi:hypothetical protein
MGSKLVVDRQKSSEAVCAALGTHGGSIESGIAGLYGADTGSAVRMLLERAQARLAADTAAMVRADDEHLKESADDAEVLANRDASAENVYAALTEFREVGTAVYGDAYMKKLGFEGTTPRDATALDRLAALVLDNLGTVPAPAPRKTGLTLDASQWTAPLSSSRQALSTALTATAREKREAEATLVAKNAAIEAYDKTFSLTANLASVLLAHAGQKELAGRVRPSSRRSGQTNEAAETAAATTVTAS